MRQTVQKIVRVIFFDQYFSVSAQLRRANAQYGFGTYRRNNTALENAIFFVCQRKKHFSDTFRHLRLPHIHAVPISFANIVPQIIIVITVYNINCIMSTHFIQKKAVSVIRRQPFLKRGYSIINRGTFHHIHKESGMRGARIFRRFHTAPFHRSAVLLLCRCRGTGQT